TFRDALICPQLLIGLNCTSVSVSAAKISLTSDATAGTGIYKFINAGSKTLKPSSQLSGFCLGSGDDYIFLNVSLNITTDSNPLFKLLKSYGVQELRSTALYRNEPFQTGGATC
ncbi:MAG: hypothetical protein INR68_17855, partial [Methylobacterium mesophilicum]|nr:hypothetical protein [Methylobacterium mesophilicum]